MDKLSTLFTAVGDKLTGTSWFQLVQWPFWALLFLIAVGGIYHARFGKNALFCQGIQGALKLTLVYMAALVGYLWLPSILYSFSQLPFLSVTETTLTLVNPLGLLDRWKTALPQVSVRLYFLLLLINLASAFDYNGKNFLTWVLAQFVSCGTAMIIYSAISFLLATLFPSWMGPIHSILAVMLAAFWLIVVLWKIVLLLTRKTGSHNFTVVYGFLTKQKFGSRLTTAALSWLIIVGCLFLLNLLGMAQLKLASINLAAFAIIGFLCTMTLYVFNMYYCKRD